MLFGATIATQERLKRRERDGDGICDVIKTSPRRGYEGDYFKGSFLTPSECSGNLASGIASALLLLIARRRVRRVANGRVVRFCLCVAFPCLALPHLTLTLTVSFCSVFVQLSKA